MSRQKETDGRIWPKPVDEDQFVHSEDFARPVPEDQTFHIGQTYEATAAETLECAKCGSREFNVGAGSYLTVLRCPKCQWEYAWHEG